MRWKIVLAMIVGAAFAALDIVHVRPPTTVQGSVGTQISDALSRNLGVSLDAACSRVIETWMNEATVRRSKGEKPKPSSDEVNRCLGGHHANIKHKADTQHMLPGPSLVFTHTGERSYITWDFFKCADDGREGTAKEFINAVRGREIKYLILDLRLNSGGCQDPALQIADLFAPRAGMPTISEVDFKGREGRYWTKQTFLQKELGSAYVIIMTSWRTCSASEQFIGVLRLLIPERVEVVGGKTCGKHVYQIAQPFGEFWVSVHGGEWFIGHGEMKRSVKGGIHPTWPTKDVWAVTNTLFGLRMTLNAAMQRTSPAQVVGQNFPAPRDITPGKKGDRLVPKPVKIVPVETKCGPKASLGCP